MWLIEKRNHNEFIFQRSIENLYYHILYLFIFFLWQWNAHSSVESEVKQFSSSFVLGICLFFQTFKNNWIPREVSTVVDTSLQSNSPQLINIFALSGYMIFLKEYFALPSVKSFQPLFFRFRTAIRYPSLAPVSTPLLICQYHCRLFCFPACHGLFFALRLSNDTKTWGIAVFAH